MAIIKQDWRYGNDMFFGLRETLTEEQAHYLDSLQNNRLTISDSISGSGKTTLAVAMAYYQGWRLNYIFFPVEEDSMGFRPGNQQMKDSAYYGPLIDALHEIGVDPSRAIKFVDEDELLAQWKSFSSVDKSEAWITVMPHTFLRGRNIGKSGDTMNFIDEGQNGTKSQHKKILTRMHDLSNTVIAGHQGQIDLKDPTTSGWARVTDHFSKKHYCGVANLTKNFRGELSRDADDL